MYKIIVCTVKDYIFFDNVLGIVHIYKYLWIVAALYKYYLFHISGLKSLLQSHCLLLSCFPYNADIDFHTEITHLCGLFLLVLQLCCYHKFFQQLRAPFTKQCFVNDTT